jgi:sugar O-acyltransferase (sialic acid O-acetyltransferase NeuD family)
MADLIIFGAGDIARLAHRYFERDSPHRVVGFTVDAAFRTSDQCCGLPLVDFETVLDRFPPAQVSMFVALSYAKMNRVRAEKYHAAKALGYSLVSYVSSRCSYLTDAPPGENCFILEDNTVQPFVRIGNDVTLWSGNHIGHDSVIEDHVFVTSHVVISGNVTVGSFCFLGVNSTLRNSIVLAPETLVGAGAAIMKNTQPKGVYLAPRAELLDKTSDAIAL